MINDLYWYRRRRRCLLPAVTGEARTTHCRVAPAPTSLRRQSQKRTPVAHSCPNVSSPLSRNLLPCAVGSTPLSACRSVVVKEVGRGAGDSCPACLVTGSRAKAPAFPQSRVQMHGGKGQLPSLPCYRQDDRAASLSLEAFMTGR